MDGMAIAGGACRRNTRSGRNGRSWGSIVQGEYYVGENEDKRSLRLVRSPGGDRGRYAVGSTHDIEHLRNQFDHEERKNECHAGPRAIFAGEKTSTAAPVLLRRGGGASLAVGSYVLSQEEGESLRLHIANAKTNAKMPDAGTSRTRTAPGARHGGC